MYRLLIGPVLTDVLSPLFYNPFVQIPPLKLRELRCKQPTIALNISLMAQDFGGTQVTLRLW
jgi:hypothetical protein